MVSLPMRSHVDTYLTVFPDAACHYEEAWSWCSTHKGFILYVMSRHWLLDLVCQGEFFGSCVEQVARSMRSWKPDRGDRNMHLRVAVKFVGRNYRKSVFPRTSDDYRMDCCLDHVEMPRFEFKEPHVSEEVDGTRVEAAKRRLFDSGLTFREQVTAMLHFMHGWNYRKISNVFGVTKERTRQIGESALAKMQRRDSTTKLQAREYRKRLRMRKESVA